MDNPRNIGGFVFVYLAFALLVFPLKWITAFLLAVFIHELCHFAAVCFCGGRVHRIRIRLTGVYMEIGGLTALQELICTLAGPLGGLIFLLFARWLPRTALCAAFTSAYNLIPVYPMDGGRAIRCFLELIGAGKRLYLMIEWICLFVILCLGIYGTVGLRLGILPLFLSAILCYKVLRGKISCKQRQHWLQ